MASVLHLTLRFSTKIKFLKAGKNKLSICYYVVQRGKNREKESEKKNSKQDTSPTKGLEIIVTGSGRKSKHEHEKTD